jgi:uncharacterized membrane protein
VVRLPLGVLRMTSNNVGLTPGPGMPGSTAQPDVPGSPSTSSSSQERGGSIPDPQSTRFWLTVAILVYIGVALSFSILRVLNFNAANWDLGIFQQALWSSGHGKLFYESGDYEYTLVQSFFQSHPSFILYALAPLYAWMPSPVVLLGLQAIVVGLAAVPLYLIAVRLSGSRMKGLIAGLMFLAWTPVLSGNLFDFHLESFLPLELFSVFYLFLRRYYVSALLLSCLPAITIEAGPVLTFVIGLFFVWPWWKSFQASLAEVRSGLPPKSRLGPFLRRSARQIRKWLSRSEVVAGLVLMVLSLLLYVTVREIQGTVVLQFLPPGSGPASHLPGFSLARLGLTWTGLQTGLLNKLFYWTIIYALLAFIPFRVPKTILLILPWWVFTVFSGNTDFARLGYQYGLVAAAPVLIGLAYGLVTIPLGGAPKAFPQASTQEVPASTGTASTGGRGPARSSQATAWAVVIGLAIVANLAFSPVNPFVQNSHGQGPGYDVSYSLGNGTGQVLSVASLIPENATVIASDNLFPFVANHNQAYTLTSTSVIPPHLPLNATNFPTFVLICQAQLPAVPLWFSYYLYNPSFYGLRALVGETSLGPVLLFQAHYSGPTLELRPIAFQNNTVFHGRGLDVGSAGAIVSDVNDSYGTAIRSVPGINEAIWYGPYTTLPAGSYSVQVLVHGWVPAGSVGPAPGQGVLTIESTAFGHRAFFSSTYTLAQIDRGEWTSLNFTIQTSEPLLQVQVVGIPTDFKQNVVIEMNYVVISEI